MAHERAIQGQNVAEFNTLVDTYNAWIRQHLGEDANMLLMSKITTTNLPSESPTKNPLLTENEALKNPMATENWSIKTPPGAINPYVTRNPFNPSRDLAQFGQPQVRTDIMGEADYIEANTADQILRNF